MKFFLVKNISLGKDEKKMLERIFYLSRNVKLPEKVLFTSNFKEENLRRDLDKVEMNCKEIVKLIKFLREERN